VAYDFYVRYLVKKWPINIVGQHFYHCILSMPVLLVMAMVNNELRPQALTSFVALPWTSKGVIFGSAIGGYLLSTSALNLQRRISATSFSVLKNTNKVAVIVINILWIEGTPTLNGAVGLTVALGGGLWYGIANIRSRAEKRMKEE